MIAVNGHHVIWLLMFFKIYFYMFHREKKVSQVSKMADHHYKSMMM